jgi:hypothetical protein
MQNRHQAIRDAKLYLFPVPTPESVLALGTPINFPFIVGSIRFKGNSTQGYTLSGFSVLGSTSINPGTNALTPVDPKLNTERKTTKP